MAAGRRARTDGRNGCRTPTDLHVCDWGRVRGSDTIHPGVMQQRLFAIHSRSRATRKGVWPCGIGRPITSDAHKPGLGFPSWHFLTVGKSVGNCTGHPAQMAGASDEDFGTQWHTLARSSVSEDAVGQKSPRWDRFIPEHAHGGVRGDEQPEAWDAGLRRRPRAKATVLRMTHTRSVARPTTSNRHSAGRASSQDGLTLSQEEGQMDRCRHMTGTSLGEDAGVIRDP